MIPLADGALPLRFAEPCFQIFLVRAGPVPVDPELPARERSVKDTNLSPSWAASARRSVGHAEPSEKTV